MINTIKGSYAFYSIQNDIYKVETSLENIAKHNVNLSHPASKPERRKDYYKNEKKYSYKWVVDLLHRRKDYYYYLLKTNVPRSVIEKLKTIKGWLHNEK